MVAAKSDLGAGGEGIGVSSLTGQGLPELSATLTERARGLLPRTDELALDRRQHELLTNAEAALRRAMSLDNAVLVAEELRVARLAIDRISGRAGVEYLLDALFGRFCLGK
jgi:tRNA modification GTPase